MVIFILSTVISNKVIFAGWYFCVKGKGKNILVFF